MNEMVTLIDSVSAGLPNIESDYYYNGVIVPRVTKILSTCIHNDGLMYWANSLGFKHKSYAKTLAEAANIGTQCHNNIDLFMNDEDHKPPIETHPSAINAYNAFRKWFDLINRTNKVTVIFHEKTLTCKYFGGTLDGLYNINDKIYLIDYKTSNYVKYNYCLQLAAYRYMLKTELNIDIDGCIILQLDKSSPSFNEYVLSFNIPEHLSFMELCERTFLSLVYSYYNLAYVDAEYNKLDWRK